MGSDRARVSYDPSRHWRGVINQQGRVTLEADTNEAATIAAERDRASLIDVVGSSGAPLTVAGAPGGYSIAAVAAASGGFTGDLTINPGTIYVGGERMVLEAAVDYSRQPDWLDWDGDPLWTAPAVPSASESEIVYLLLREQEVGAIEDAALLDIALGGPDTSERQRIVQRVVRQTAAQPTTAAAPFNDPNLLGTWSSLGLTFEPATMRLASSATLQVQGTYAGPENQLIRVQIAGVDDAGVPTLVWGFDNAHYLYGITVDSGGGDAGPTTLTLTNVPIDVYHQPSPGQTVEVLEAAAQLTPTDASNYIAATSGHVTTITATGGYQPDTQQLVVTAGIQAPAAGSPPLFLRVWQGTVTYPAGGGQVPLGDTGLTVTLSLPAPTAGSPVPKYHVGDYWQVAVRAGTSTVYPERILSSPQPPDGPRLWACPLALIAWSSSGTPTVTDCREQFDTLVGALAARTATDISYNPGTCEVLQGAQTVADALNLLCAHAQQGDDFPLALLRLFGRGVISGVIPSITVSPPAAGATEVAIDISVTDGTVIDGRGMVLSISGVPPLQTSVTSFTSTSTGTVGTEVQQWLYLVTGDAQPPGLQLAGGAPTGALTVPADVVSALNNPAGGPTIDAGATCAVAETEAWQMYSDVPPGLVTNTDGAICLGMVGVQGQAGWTAPDDREQVFPTPAITSTVWLSQRKPVYDTIKAACTAGAVNVQSVSLGAHGAPSLQGQALLAGTAGRTATVMLDDVVRGTTPLSISFQSSSGVTVHGPIAIAPGGNSGAFTFDIANVAGPQTITAIIDASRQLEVSFTSVQLQTPALPGGATSVMWGPVSVSVALSAPASETVTVTLTGTNVSLQGSNITFAFVPSAITIPANSTSGASVLTVQQSGGGGGSVQVSAAAQVAGAASAPSGLALRFLLVTLEDMVTALGATLNNSTIGGTAAGAAANSISGVTVRLSAPAPTALTIGISVSVASGGTAALTATPTSVTVAQGAMASGPFTLTTVGGQSGTQTVVAAFGTLSTQDTVTVSPPKTTKERKDGKDIGKEQPDKAVALEKVEVDIQPPLRQVEQVEDSPGAEAPEGRSFVPPSLRPDVGTSAFDEPGSEDEE